MIVEAAVAVLFVCFCMALGYAAEPLMTTINGRLADWFVESANHLLLTAVDLSAKVDTTPAIKVAVFVAMLFLPLLGTVSSLDMDVAAVGGPAAIGMSAYFSWMLFVPLLELDTSGNSRFSSARGLATVLSLSLGLMALVYWSRYSGTQFLIACGITLLVVSAFIAMTFFRVLVETEAVVASHGVFAVACVSIAALGVIGILSSLAYSPSHESGAMPVIILSGLGLVGLQGLVTKLRWAAREVALRDHFSADSSDVNAVQTQLISLVENLTKRGRLVAAVVLMGVLNLAYGRHRLDTRSRKRLAISRARLAFRFQFYERTEQICADELAYLKSVDSDSGLLRSILSMSLIKLQRAKEALEVLSENPRQNPYISLQRSHLHWHSGDLDEARHWNNAVLAKDSSCPLALRNDAYFDLENLDADSESLARASKTLDRAATAARERFGYIPANILHCAGLLEIRRGNFSEARRTLVAAIRLEDHPPSRLALATLMMRGDGYYLAAQYQLQKVVSQIEEPTNRYRRTALVLLGWIADARTERFGFSDEIVETLFVNPAESADPEPYLRELGRFVPASKTCVVEYVRDAWRQYLAFLNLREVDLALVD